MACARAVQRFNPFMSAIDTGLDVCEGKILLRIRI
jgi:hypothetical protein